jgi:hypothetical protein
MENMVDGIWYEYVNWFQLVQVVVQPQEVLNIVMTSKISQGTDLIPAEMF